MNKIEILAPVGGSEQLVAAVRSGADAVYFGAGGFNARRNAENFSEEGFIEAVKYCRERGVKAYITLNTLIKDSEEEELIKTVALIAKSGADAVIIQDMGVFSILKKCCPHIPVHASTQMAVHNVAGAKRLEKLGFSRIVLARELSISEIKLIAEAANTETEVFVHGAHCMSASGMCYMSSFLGARSGNRGLCAQPCRLNFRWGKREYALSLKDMCLAHKVEELVSAGVCSLKIEGRMKRPEYVAGAVSVYKKALNGKEYDVELLKNIFSRSGFTDGYATGKRNLSMFGYRTKEDVVAAGNELLNTVANTYRNERPLVGISMDFTVRENEKACLSISDGVRSVTVTGAVPEKAMKLPLTRESVEKNLLKLGSTFYFSEKYSITLDEGLMLRASDINAMRRDACERLTELRGQTQGYSFLPPKKESFAYKEDKGGQIRLRFGKISSVPENISADMLIIPSDELLSDTAFTEKYKACLCAELPALIYPYNEEKEKEKLISLREQGIKYAYCENIGAVELALEAGMEAVGGALLNILNSRAAEAYYRMGVRSITLSPEMSFKEMRNIKTHCTKGIIAYGYMPLMHFRCCPLQGEKGCADCKGRGEIVDRIGEKFTVLCKNRQYSVLYNTVPLYVGDKKLPELSFATLSFTTENAYKVREVLDATVNKKALAGKKTAGLYERELL